MTPSLHAHYSGQIRKTSEGEFSANQICPDLERSPKLEQNWLDLERSPKLEQNWPDLGENWSLNAGKYTPATETNGTESKNCNNHLTICNRNCRPGPPLSTQRLVRVVFMKSDWFRCYQFCNKQHMAATSLLSV